LRIPHSETRRRIQLALGIVSLCAVPHLAASSLIADIHTDRAQYRTGDTITVSISLRNDTPATWSGAVRVTPRFLGHTRALSQSQVVSLPLGQEAVRVFAIVPPPVNDRGYLVEIDCIADDGSLTDQATTAFDVADDWTRFPRYGFLTRFSDDVSAADMLAPLRDYKINVVQYYDWMDEHHIPYRPGFDYWQDIAARDPWVSRVKLNQLIALGRQYNMAALAYNLMYGAYDDYATESGLSLASGMFMSPLGTNGYSLADQDRHELDIAGWETQRLYLFNPADQSWRDWIALQFQTAFAALPFDGWHIDTLGERGPRYDSTGAEFDLAATYSGFVNDMRAQLGPDKPLVVNTVSNYGLTPIAQHADVAVLYSELWNGALEDEFYDLKLTLDSARAVTDKPMVIAGYMNYDAAQLHDSQSPGAFNEPGILLADAAIFANGGWHIELGDGLNMLSNEYFPRQALVMSPSLQAKLRDYYNFAVAYENLLRDRVTNGNKRIDFDLGGSTFTSYNASAGTVWKIAKTRTGLGCATAYDIAHLINLTGTTSTIWRDLDGSSPVPVVIENKPVRLYYDGAWAGSTVWYASPDADGGRAAQVSDYQRMYDAVEQQWYVEFTLPRLHYWTMLWLERRPAASADANCDGRVDLIDYAEFADCFTGPDFGSGWNNPNPACTTLFDLDGDADLDLRDFAELQGTLGQP
jgi:dextranase